MSIIFWVLGVGILVGSLNLVPRKIQNNLHYISTAALILLLFSMGAKLGSNHNLMSEIGSIGLQSLGLAIAAIVGSVILVYVFEVVLNARKEIKEGKEVQRS